MLTVAVLDAPTLPNRGITARLRTCAIACRLELRSLLWSEAGKANFLAWSAMLEEAADEIDRLMGLAHVAGRALPDDADQTCELCGEECCHHPDCPEAVVAGQPVGDERALGAAASEGVAQ
jgi:NTP pyrophosphatase (non-canonical NTP hydrolase)